MENHISIPFWQSHIWHLNRSISWYFPIFNPLKFRFHFSRKNQQEYIFYLSCPHFFLNLFFILIVNLNPLTFFKLFFYLFNLFLFSLCMPRSTLLFLTPLIALPVLSHHSLTSYNLPLTSIIDMIQTEY